MSSIKKVARCLVAACLALAWLGAAAVEYRLAPIADTTVFGDNQGGQTFDGLSDGGPNLWLSTTQGGQTRRALLRFDLSAIPAGSQVTSVQLAMYEIRARGNHVVSVHRLLNTWGEATSDAGDSGSGVPANPGDATWSHRFYPSVPWAQRGGDLVPQASTSLFVGFSGETYTWPSTPQMVADVQGWLADSASNHGWIVIGDDVTDGSAKRMASRENGVASLRPVLVVQAEPPAPLTEGDTPLPLWASLLLGAGLLSLLRRSR